MALTAQSTTHYVSERELNESDTKSHMKFIFMWSIFLGLILNWLALYLRISMGFVSIGIGPMVILLFSRKVFQSKHIDTRENLTIVIIAYSATSAAEASVSLLFVIWLTYNASYFNMEFNPPSWFLPRRYILDNKILFSREWVLPLLTHYFLMFIPGIVGITIGWLMKDKFIHDNDKYPFPGVIQNDAQIGILTDEADSKGSTFWKFVQIAFIVALITNFVPHLLVLDFSNTTNSSIAGILLGPVGVAFFAVGLIINKKGLSLGIASTSILAYSILSIWVVDPIGNVDYYTFFGYALQNNYLSPAIALLIGGLILGPIFWGIISSLFKKNKSTKENPKSSETEKIVEHTGSEIQKRSLVVRMLTNWKYILIILAVYSTCTVFVIQTHVLGNTSSWVIAVVIFWIVVIGGFANSFLLISGVSRANTGIAVPFLFDNAAVYAAGGAGLLPYLAIPSAETDGSVGIVQTQKLAQLNGVNQKLALRAYIAGYVAGSTTTPIFALLLWYALGIGSARFPAPAFPVQGAIVATFASRHVDTFINLKIFLIFIAVGIVLVKLNVDIAMGAAIGLFLPPHMAIPLALGGIIRAYSQRGKTVEEVNEKMRIVGSALAVGASFVIPIMIIQKLIF